MKATAPLSIGVVFDVVCPWCYVGEKQLDRALAHRPDLIVELDYHPFLLHPWLGPEGADRRELASRKFGSVEVARALEARMREAAARVGISFAPELGHRVPDTVAAHCVVRWTPPPRRRELVHALYEAYFERARDIGDHTVLAELSTRVGLDAGDVRAKLDAGVDRDEVRAHAEDMRREGVTGVPFFVVDGRFAIPGAQEPETLLAVIDGACRMCSGEVC